jgi:preprotein translocase subunit SecG
MSMTIFLMVQVLLAVALIALILIQRGRGADAGAAFGSGASTTVFGARGSASFLTRTTSILAILFFTNCFVLSYLAGRMVTTPKSIMENTGTATVAPEKSEELPPIDKAGQTGNGPVEKSDSANAGATSGEVPTVKSKNVSEVPAVRTEQAPGEPIPAPVN